MSLDLDNLLQGEANGTELRGYFDNASIDFQGYLNGAVETGERAAEEVIADLG